MQAATGPAANEIAYCESTTIYVTRYEVFCANCSEKIMGEPLVQAGEYFCSVECANAAQGIDPDEPLIYETDAFDQDFLDEEE